MSGERCSLTQAIDILILAPLSPTKAANRLTQGMRDYSCRPYCNGKMIPSNIAPRLMVVVYENDGSWVARIESTTFAAGGGVQPTWEFEIDEVKALLAAERARAAAASTTTDHSRRRDPPGRKPKNDWPEDVKAAVALKIRDDPKILRKPNYDALNREIRADFDKPDHYRWLPNDPKETEKIIREFLQRLRDLTPP